MIISKLLKPDKWIEECKNHYVIVLINPCGIDFQDENMVVTTQQLIHCEAINLQSIIKKYSTSNIWRSWMTYSDKNCKTEVGYIPLILDIDNDNQNIHDAYKLTIDCLSAIEQMDIPEMNYRVVFSGKKGFHVELKSHVEIDFNKFRKKIISDINEMGKSKQEYYNKFSTGIIDVAHEFVRLTGSSNSWKENHEITNRKVIQFSVEEFKKIDVETILGISEINQLSI